MGVAESIGYVAAALVFATFWMRTMIPLRIIAIVSNLAFIAYAQLEAMHPVLVLHALLLPLNIYRLAQMRRLITDVRAASEGKFSMDWALPFATRLTKPAGAVLFRKGEDADTMLYVVSGSVHLPEIDIEVGKGEMLGEIGLFSPEGKRTGTAVCRAPCEFLVMTRKTVQELYFQNPTFGFYLLGLITARLVDNLQKLERRVAQEHSAKV